MTTPWTGYAQDVRSGGVRGGAASPHTPFPPAAAGQPGETRNEWNGWWRACGPPPFPAGKRLRTSWYLQEARGQGVCNVGKLRARLFR